METFAQSQGGRLMMAAHAAFLGTTAVYLFTGSLYAWGIGMPLGITFAFISVGLSLEDYLKEAFIGITLLPVALWCFTYLAGELDWRATSWPAYLMAGAALIAAFFAVAPPGAKTA
jgi:hypothetical protein